MFQNPRDASPLLQLAFGSSKGSFMAFKQLQLDLKTQTYPFQMALKFYSILLDTYRILKRNSQEFRSKTSTSMIF